MNHAEFARYLDREIKREGGQRALAMRLAVAPTYIDQIRRLERPPSDKVLKGMGFERVVSYRRIKTIPG